jgi:hypothetical protein
MAWRNLLRMRRLADPERRRDTRRKIQLGGLVINAGLAEEEPAVILGLLTAAQRAALCGPFSRRLGLGRAAAR